MRSQGYIEIESSSSDSEDDREVAATASSAAFSGTDGRDSQSIQDLSHFFLGVVVRRCRGIFGCEFVKCNDIIGCVTWESYKLSLAV